ncbi:MAG: leucine--tRNA ligase [Thermoplasmata archaeon]|nr:leucine--tRNA ligase [Thermoplasmata archaeon]
MRGDYNYIAVEKKWQKRWFDTQLYKAEINLNKNKFFIHFAYPGVSGYLHVGHMRGFTYCDIIARYKKMQGFNVIFPAGFHASGIPSIGFAKKVERGDRDTIRLLKENGCSEELIEKLKDPVEVVNYFSRVYVEDYWKRFGFLIDYTRLMSTISEGYKRFIQWQFYKLDEKNLLIKKPHFAPYCPNCGPVAVDKSETDISKGGSAEILEFTVIKFKLEDGTILPAATLRPETIFGVTNMWIHPDIEYVKIRLKDETWICSKECASKLTYQLENVETLDETVNGKDLLGKNCIVPLTNHKVPILPSKFVDPKVATGIVMSVPAHAPYDYIALVESKKDIQPISIIKVEGFSDIPAKDVCEELGITSTSETEKLDKATEIVYKKEFHTGILNENCGEYAGLRISEIKDIVKNRLIEENLAEIMLEFSEEVICRCGENVFIKRIPDQWFIKYSDEKLTEESKKHVETMNIYPEDYKKELPGVLDWFGDRACIRKGSWLGTEFPFKKGWIIEPISDSTLYSAYYIISKFVNEKKIDPKDLTNEFFDYVFLGKGEAKDPIWEEIKREFDYWYPVDINLGGKEHKTVHFPVFIMNHVAIMPKDKWPRGIFVNWWVTQKGREKISKSKGGAEPIPKAATTYGVDALRLYYAHVGSPFIDIEWDPEVVEKYKNRINSLWNTINQLIKVIKNGEPGSEEDIDRWLKSVINRRIKRINEAMEKYDLRVAANEIFFEYLRDLQWYQKRGGKNSTILNYAVSNLIKLMTPFTPHLAEELWEEIGSKNFVSTQQYPLFDEKSVHPNIESGERLVANIIEDINEILKVTKIKPNRIILYTAPSWKWFVFREAVELLEKNNLEMGTLMKKIINENTKNKVKEISKFAGKLIGELKKISKTDLENIQASLSLNEKDYLERASKFIEQEVNASVEIYDADDKRKYDPKGKASFAVPLRPAVYIE